MQMYILSKTLNFTCRLNPLVAGLGLNPGLKTDASSKEIEEAMKRVREAQSLISAAIEPGSKYFSVFFLLGCFSLSLAYASRTNVLYSSLGMMKV